MESEKTLGKFLKDCGSVLSVEQVAQYSGISRGGMYLAWGRGEVDRVREMVDSANKAWADVVGRPK